ncbi:DUF4350 domain-containing protein [Haliangium sp.]|uniref:DUF4350 domain-containing protein n=1 Tax=Haliangium sp. TaxID=2663208 RepID=UPI003D0A841F
MAPICPSRIGRPRSTSAAPTAIRAATLTAAVATALTMALIVAAPAARAQGQSRPDDDSGAATVDYDPDSRAWNGLHTLTAVARGLGLQVTTDTEVTWEELGAEDVLFVLYPETRLDPSHTVSFIRNGGHVLLADDFGDSADVLGRLGMLRQPGGGAAPRFYRDLDHAPVAVPMAPGHPLAAEVDELVTNLPGVLAQVRGAQSIFGFGPEATVVAAGSLGRGRFVVVSDASLFINRMLQFQGNMQFTINALRWLMRPGRTTRVVILARAFHIAGEPRAVFPSGSVSDTVSGVSVDINRMLDEGNDYLLTEWALHLIALLLAGVIAGLGVLIVPSVRRGRMEGKWTRVRAAGDGEHHAALVARYDRERGDTDFMLPAVILRDSLYRTLSAVLQLGEPPTRLNTEQLVDLARAQCGAPVADALARLHPRLEALPVRQQAASPVRTGYVSRRDFERLRREVDALRTALGEDLHEQPIHGRQ